MMDRLTHKLQHFTIKLDLGLKCTHQVLALAKSESWSKLEREIANRERLLDIISQEQVQIESHIDALISEELTPNNINIIKSWAFDTQNWINEVARLDDIIVAALNDSRDNATKEIATIFKSKAAFRGYNLNDVRK